MFGALADPTRRALLTRLTRGDASVAELAAPFTVSQPAISRHLKVLERAGLITRTRRATARLSHLRAEPLREATAWLAAYREYWEESYERLDELLEALSGIGRRPRREHVMKLNVTAEPGVPQVITSRTFDAPRDLVYRAFTEPDLLVQWLGPRQYTMTIERYDLRDGGTYRYIHADDAGNAYAFHGVFHGDPSPTAWCRPSSSRARPATSRWTP